MTGWTSTIPAATDALLRIVAAAPELDGVDVRDGPTIGSAAATEILSVGWSGVEGESDAEAQVLGEGLGNRSDRENFTIRCAAAVLLGNTTVSAGRARVYELMAAAGTAIARDRRLQGTVMQALIGSHSLMYQQIDRGLQVVLTFSVDCDAYTRP